MKRFLLELVIACPILVARVGAIGVAAWSLVVPGLNELVSPLLVLGLPASVPLAVVAADRLEL